MYLNYFGLSEASFSITPDPQYLFLTEQHREALAHLLYGAGENGGFVLLTGEVGTGKTTICRAFLEQTPEQVDVALVLNPAMTAIELMHAICQEFGVATPEHHDSVKVLVDRLNRFLLDAHARGRHPVVVIDEAQNLRPRVLEQVRLLTNLETSKQKLLQIFLIGQPELREILASQELRQLNQRITARFHLSPLSARETAAYVDHRITVAGVQRPLFNAAALREVHRRSRGVPRLINLICDRSLLGAAVSRRMQVTPAIVRRAAHELLGGEQPRQRPRRQPQWAMAAALVLALGLGGWLGASGLLERTQQQLDRVAKVWAELSVDDEAAQLAGAADSGTDADPESGGAADKTAADGELMAANDTDSASLAAEASETDQVAAIDPGAVSAEQAGAELSAATAESAATPLAETNQGIPRIALARITLQVPEVEISELPALLLDEGESISALVQRWGHAPEEAADCYGVSTLGLECERSRERWSDLRLFDRPAVLQLLIDGQERYALITGIDDEFAVLQRGETLRRVPIAALDERWSGDVLMLWRLPPDGVRMIGPGTSGDAVLWLREQLAALPDASLTDTSSPRYDANLRAVVREFQAGRGLAVDGIAGPRTLILLNNALADSEIPRLSQSQSP
ncbi:AAA family ATPase [Lamprobacter modestohalophilus]|uniref:AAA family ATPase n=1 Tax=Lamprobacter modestohalophilus TaxID=1064514 RepID=UPI002ADEC0D4|nr:AAA family ATPase [Lamprobacter modestohalophilus]MEA1048283.1 AAA family ATPase [Lamprobacter modestohalophilus]